MTLFDTQEVRLIKNLYDKATDLNCCSGDCEMEQDALELALIELENAGYADGVFKWKNAIPDCTKALRHAALSPLNTLTTEGSTNAQNERESLVLALSSTSQAGV